MRLVRVLIKIVLTFVALIIATPIFAVTKEVPFLKLVLLAGLVAGIAAIWKYNPDKNNENKSDENDKYQLDKRQ